MFSASSVVTLFMLVLFALSGCEPTISPPTPITRNADWTPLVQAFEGIEMVQVPAGCFTMGSDEGRRDERPAHPVCFAAPYWIGRTEVTNAQFDTEGVFPGANRPRTNLTWSEARDFCLSKEMRLPTEAQWEYAARGVDSLDYPWGNEFNADALVYDANSNNQPADVGSRPAGASWVGALDMSGNVHEWVSSLYQRYPYNADDGREDAANTTDARVFRSGINSYIDFGTSTHIRFNMEPGGRDWFVGFRCARDN